MRKQTTKNFETTGQYSKNKGKIDEEQLENWLYNTGAMPDGFERKDTSMQQFPIEENKEDDYATEIHGYGSKRDEDGDGAKLGYDPLKPQNQFLRLFDSESDKHNNTMAYHTQGPFISNNQKQQQNYGEEKEENIMEKKHLVNELVDYNLYLLRSMYDAYEERAD